MLTPVAAQAILVPRNAARRIKVILKSCFLEEIAPTEKGQHVASLLFVRASKNYISCTVGIFSTGQQ
jgi:hypothetical protein